MPVTTAGGPFGRLGGVYEVTPNAYSPLRVALEHPNHRCLPPGPNRSTLVARLQLKGNLWKAIISPSLVPSPYPAILQGLLPRFGFSATTAQPCPETPASPVRSESFESPNP